MNGNVRERFYQLVEKFAAGCGDSIQKLSYERIPCPSGLRILKSLEIMTYHVPACDADRHAFEYAYSNYIK